MYPIESNLDNLYQVINSFNSGFQLVQEKIYKIMANTQAVLLMCFRISKLVDEKKHTIGQVALTKAFVTERTR